MFSAPFLFLLVPVIAPCFSFFLSKLNPCIGLILNALEVFFFALGNQRKMSSLTQLGSQSLIAKHTEADLNFTINKPNEGQHLCTLSFYCLGHCAGSSDLLAFLYPNAFFIFSSIFTSVWVILRSSLTSCIPLLYLFRRTVDVLQLWDLSCQNLLGRTAWFIIIDQRTLWKTF